MVLVSRFKSCNYHKMNLETEITNWSDHVLHWLLTEEAISQAFRGAIHLEMAKRSLDTSRGIVRGPVAEETVTLTFQMLHDASTKGFHGFTYAQLAAIGVAIPPKRGWLKGLVGKTIPASQWRQFVEAVNTKARK